MMIPQFRMIENFAVAFLYHKKRKVILYGDGSGVHCIDEKRNATRPKDVAYQSEYDEPYKEIIHLF